MNLDIYPIQVSCNARYVPVDDYASYQQCRQIRQPQG